MFFYEIPKNASIIVEVKLNNGKRYEFETTIKEINDKKYYSLCTAIKYNEKLLNLNELLTNVIYIKKNHKPIIFKNVLIEIFRNNKNEVFHKITSKKEGIEYNRRNDYRINIGNLGISQLGENNKSYSVIIKDISKSGFAISIEKKLFKEDSEELRCINEKQITASFIDNPTKKMEYNLHLNGEVVRVIELEDKYIFGCSLVNGNSKLYDYLMIKQREELKKMREREEKVLFYEKTMRPKRV